MKTLHMVLIGAGAIGVGYLVFRPKDALALSGGYLPAVQVQRTVADAQAVQAALLRSLVGAKAASGASAGSTSVINQALSGANAKASGLAGSAADKLIPGSGGIVKSIAGGVGSVATGATISLGEKTVAGIKNLFGW
jgi:hypothetical protein